MKTNFGEVFPERIRFNGVGNPIPNVIPKKNKLLTTLSIPKKNGQYPYKTNF